MKILCIYFNSSNRIQEFINYVEKKYNNIILDKYNAFNKNDFKSLNKNRLNYYDGIFLLGTGTGTASIRGEESKSNILNITKNYSNIPNKKSVNDLIKKKSKIIECINTIIYNNIKTPIIGICYGGQILNLFYRGELHTNLIRNQGFFETQLDLSNKLFKNLDKHIYPQYNNKFSCINNFSKPIAISNNNKMVSCYQHSNYHYSLDFHLIKSDKSCFKIIDNFINIVEENSKKLYILRVLLVTIVFLFAIIYLNMKYKNLNVIKNIYFKKSNTKIITIIFLILIYITIIYFL